MWKIILSSFLIVNALFWGLYPHTDKCEMAYFLGIEKCPSFLIHALIGSLFYISAILIVHFNSFFHNFRTINKRSKLQSKI